MGQQGCYHLVATRKWEDRNESYALFCEGQGPIQMYKRRLIRKHLDIIYPWWQGFGRNRRLRLFSCCGIYSCNTPRCLLYDFAPLSSDLIDLFGLLPPRYGRRC